MTPTDMLLYLTGCKQALALCGLHVHLPVVMSELTCCLSICKWPALDILDEIMVASDVLSDVFYP